MLSLVVRALRQRHTHTHTQTHTHMCVRALTEAEPHQRRQDGAPVDGRVLEAGADRRQRSQSRFNQSRMSKLWAWVHGKRATSSIHVKPYVAEDIIEKCDDKPFFPASERTSTMDLMRLFSER